MASRSNFLENFSILSKEVTLLLLNCINLVNLLVFSSPEPKAHRWAYSIGRYPSSDRPSSSSVVNIFKRHLFWSHEADSCHISYISYIGRANEYYCVCPNRIRTLVAMTTYNCHWLIMWKNENWHLLLSHCRYLNLITEGVRPPWGPPIENNAK